MIRLIATDLDGTLLTGYDTISDENLRVIRRAVAEGITFAIASGRRAASCSRLLRRYGLDGPVIAFNGGHILARPGGETIAVHPMDRSLAKECIRIIEGHALHACLCTKEWVVYSSLEALCYYCGPHSTPLDKEKLKADGLLYGKDAMAEAFQGTPLKALCAFSPGQKEAFEAARAACSELPGVHMTSSWRDNFEVMPEGVNKATGLTELAAWLGIARDEVMAFGDNNNDMEMLQWAGIGVAMENATREAKRAADYITKACDEAGVAHAVNRFMDWQ